MGWRSSHCITTSTMSRKVGGTKGVIDLRPSQPSARRVYQPIALPLLPSVTGAEDPVLPVQEAHAEMLRRAAPVPRGYAGPMRDPGAREVNATRAGRSGRARP